MTSYVTISEASNYFDTHLNTNAWDEASDKDRLKALYMGTRDIDSLNFLGDKTSETQEHQFPRGTDTDVPEDIKIACYEIALARLDGVDPEIELQNLRMVSQGFGNVRSTYETSISLQHIVAGIASAVAWRYLLPYLRSNVMVVVSRGS